MTTETQQRARELTQQRFWRAIGKIEGQIESVKNAVDRLFYLILGIGGATIASVWASNLFGG